MLYAHAVCVVLAPDSLKQLLNSGANTFVNMAQASFAYIYAENNDNTHGTMLFRCILRLFIMDCG